MNQVLYKQNEATIIEVPAFINSMTQDDTLERLFKKTVSDQNWNWRYTKCQLAELFNISNTTVTRRLKALDLFTWRSDLPGNSRNQEIYKLYLNKKLSITAIEKLTRVNETQLTNLLKRWKLLDQQFIGHEIKLITGKKFCRMCQDIYVYVKAPKPYKIGSSGVCRDCSPSQAYKKKYDQILEMIV